MSNRGLVTADDLLAEAARNRTSEGADASILDPAFMADALQWVLGEIMSDMDYEAEKRGGRAIAARTLAAMVLSIREIGEGSPKH